MKTGGKSRSPSRGRLISVAVVVLAVALALFALPERNVRPTTSDGRDYQGTDSGPRVRSLTMETAGKSRTAWRGRLISVAVVILAVALALYALHESNVRPTTSDSSIDADIVHVAAAVGGRIIQLPISENARVAAGDLLFQIDPLPYRLALEQAAGDLDIAEAQLETQRRVLATQRSAAVIAADQTKSARENHELATRSLERLRPLASKGYVPKQELDQAQVLDKDTATKLIQAQEQEAAAYRAIDTEAAAEATVRARKAALAIAQRQLGDTTVRASHNGLVVGLRVSTGEMVVPSQSLFTLINTDEWFANANFRETDLSAIAIGDCATVFSLIDRKVPIRGVVQGIGWGVTDQDIINIPRSVPFVERSMNWVRVAQRFPVRVRIENPPQQLMRLGASAVVEVKHGAACR
jgi:multidrug efflux system membrane fusion protein